MHTLTTHIRWTIRRDVPRVMAIEEECQGYDAWSEAEFLAYLRKRNVISMLIEVEGIIAGFMVYALHVGQLEILNLAVDPNYQRQRIGTALVNKLKSKLAPQRRRRLTALVRERNVDAQVFFRELGFKWLRTIPMVDCVGDEDGYEMEYCVKE